MKKFYTPLVIILIFFQFASCVTDEGCDTPEVYSVSNVNIVLYPYLEEDTISFIKNNVDTVTYKRGLLESDWTYLPTNATVCPKKYETVYFKYTSNIDSNSIVVANVAYVGDASRCYYAGKYIGPYSTYFGASDSVIINNVVYKNLTMYYNQYGGDTNTYVLRSGRRIVKIKCNDSVLTLL